MTTYEDLMLMAEVVPASLSEAELRREYEGVSLVYCETVEQLAGRVAYRILTDHHVKGIESVIRYNLARINNLIPPLPISLDDRINNLIPYEDKP